MIEILNTEPGAGLTYKDQAPSFFETPSSSFRDFDAIRSHNDELLSQLIEFLDNTTFPDEFRTTVSQHLRTILDISPLDEIASLLDSRKSKTSLTFWAHTPSDELFDEAKKLLTVNLKT